MKIGDIEITGKTVLGPMAGFTDRHFRALCTEQGASLCFTEMISAKGLHYKSPGSAQLLTVKDEDRPIGIQLFGSEPDIITEEALKLEDGPYDFFDINMGCPMPKIVNNGEGSALMLKPELAGSIVRSLSDALKKPVTVKIRKGFDDKHVNAVQIAKIAEDNGAAAVTVHGRTREEYYSGKADRDIIRQVKEAVSIPVIGSGDVADGPGARAMLDETGCDAVMIARAARGNPWIFREINAYLAGRPVPGRPSPGEIRSTIERQLLSMKDEVGEWSAVRQMRKHAGFYCAGFPGSANLRFKINQAESIKEIEEILDKWTDRCDF